MFSFFLDNENTHFLFLVPSNHIHSELHKGFLARKYNLVLGGVVLLLKHSPLMRKALLPLAIYSANEAVPHPPTAVTGERHFGLSGISLIVYETHVKKNNCNFNYF